MSTDIGQMMVQFERRLAKVEAQSRLHSASLDDAALLVRDGAGSLRGIVGQQGDGTTAVNIVNGPTPPQPTAPIVTSVLGGVTASWDGQFTEGATLPLDWARTEVHTSTATGFTPDAGTLRSTIETAQGATVVVPTDDAVYVRLVARTTSGVPSVPSEQTGPYGPAPVVATDIIDGIVTTVKLADDAVTEAKVATGAIGTTQIADDAVTTPKLIAGAVQTAQLDAEAVNASKIAAGAVTTTKLDALAVTTDKIDANAITVGKLAAGSVDATALKADAITGKAITGGTVTGATVQTATAGARIVMDTNHLAVRNSDGDLLAEIDPLDPSGRSAFTTYDTRDGVGYYSTLTAADVRFGVTGLTEIANEAYLSFSQNGSLYELLASSGNGVGAASADIAMYSETGPSAGDSEIVLNAHKIRVVGNMTHDTTTFSTYTPTVAGGGSATFTTRTGWYYQLGALVYVNAEFVVGTAGTGTAQVTVTAPTNIYRDSRQALTAHARGAYVSGMAADGAAILLESTSGGSGNVMDQLALSNDAATNRDGILKGSDLLAGARITISGWYRKA